MYMKRNRGICLQIRRGYGTIEKKRWWCGMDIFRDPESMEPEELRAYLADVREELEVMDEDEPEDETSEEFVDWAERHEELEDLADELVERLEALGEPLE